MKCRVCREPAIIDIRRHNANFCAEHFLRLCRDQVQKAIDEFGMLERGERALVAVSGGKDSLAVWDILMEMGYEADGLYLGLGIGEYSDESALCARAYAEKRGAKLITVDTVVTLQQPSSAALEDRMAGVASNGLHHLSEERS